MDGITVEQNGENTTNYALYFNLNLNTFILKNSIIQNNYV